MARIVDLGVVDYQAGWERQVLELGAVIDGASNAVIVCEHHEVYTVGRARAAEANLLNTGDVPVVAVERGGDVTWHGPGQLVVYPILRLEGPARDLHAHLRRLEQVVIDAVAPLGIAAGRDPRNTGVWFDGRKFCSVGIACRRWVTWHGLAINCDVDLTVFSRINPCGMPSATMTSLTAALERTCSVGEVKAQLLPLLAEW